MTYSYTLVRFRSATIALLAILLLHAVPSSGQTGRMEDCAGGTHYLLAFPDTVVNRYDSRFPSHLTRTNTRAFTFYIYTPVKQSISIGRVNSVPKVMTVHAGSILEYNAESTVVPLVTVINTPQTNVLRIRSEYPVIVYGYMLTPFGAEAYTAIPVDAWGQQYFAATWPGGVVRDVSPKNAEEYRAVPIQAPSEILIIAAYDNTQVRIQPRAMLKDCAGCQNVTLKAGEAYLVQSTVDTNAGAERQPDLAGTYIVSSKRIGVITGNTRLMHNAGVRPAISENSPKNLVFEWLPPVEQHGTEFVFTPTWDEQRQRDGLELEDSRDAEIVRIYGTKFEESDETHITWRDNTGRDVPAVTTPVREGEFTHEKIGVPVARSFHTSQPAMAFSSPQSVITFNDSVLGSPSPIKSYLSWSTFMVELVPREQWTSFAPVVAPGLPASMDHYVNLVTDTNNRFNVYYRQGDAPRRRFPFDRDVPGSDLIWGTIAIPSGAQVFLEGDNGARFTGHAYGSYRGSEEWRPRFSPGEYEEEIALMYGYPLAPSRCVLASPDEYEITTRRNCEIMDIEIKTKNVPASGVGSIVLPPDSSANVRLEFIDPANPLDLKSQRIVEAKLRLVAIDPTKDAYAVVIITDRTRESKRWRVVYKWEAEKVDLNPSDEVDFGEVTINRPAGEKLVTITNPLQRDIVVKRLTMVFGTQGFVITRTDPSFNWRDNNDSVVLKPGESLKVWVDITPTETRRHEDSLRIQLGCVIQTLPLKATSVNPCLLVDDLDFGTLQIDQSRTLDLEVCNVGLGDITFQEPWLTWRGNDFGVAQGEIDKLKGLTLGSGECVTIRVAFSAGSVGLFRTTARFWASTRECRDTSIWSVRVSDPTMGVAGEETADGYCIRSIAPNPFSGETRVDFRLGRAGHTTVEVFNSDGERVAVLANERMSAGEQSVLWNAEGAAAGAYHIRVRSGEWSGARGVVVR